MERLKQILVFNDLLISNEMMPLSRHLKLKVSKGTSEESLHEVSEDHQMARNQSQNSRILWQNRAEVKGLCADAKQMSLNLSFTVYLQCVIEQGT